MSKINRNPIRLIASDLDRTLLSDEGEIKEYTQAVIARLLQEGVLIVPGTSRAYGDLPGSLLETAIRYYVCSNGAIVWDRQKGSIYSRHAMSASTAIRILEATQAISKAVTIVSEGKIYSEKAIVAIFESQGMHPQIMKRLGKKRTLVDDITTVLPQFEFIDKLHLNFPDTYSKQECLKLLPPLPQCNLTSSHPGNIEITDIEADKGKAVKQLADLYGIKQNGIMSFGDSENDLRLFDVAGVKVAMINGEEKVKQAADRVTELNNEQEGVAHFISDFLGY